MFDPEEFKARLADRFTATELVDLLDVSVEDVIEIWLDRLMEREDILEEVGMLLEENE